MAAPYSKDLRDRVLAAYDRGMQTKGIAEVFEVSPAWARMVRQRRRETGETAPRPMGGATVIKIERARMAKLVREQPDAALRELRERLGIQCAESAICMALRGLGLSLTKRRFTRPSRTARTRPSVVSSGSPTRPAGIAEMLLQSHDGAVHLLPALPAEWPAGSITGLRARGGLRVDMAWSEGELTAARIHAPTPEAITVRWDPDHEERVVPVAAAGAEDGPESVWNYSWARSPDGRP